MLYHHNRNYGCRINKELSYKGLRIAVLENEYLRVSVLIDKGTDIFEFLYKPKDIDFMWLSPWGINSPSKFIPSINSKDGNFIDYYLGGWPEILPNFGYSVEYRGIEEGLNGEICLIPWEFQILEDGPSKISIKFMVRTCRTPFYLEKTLTLCSNDPKLYVSEKLKNEGYTDIELNWVHHPTFGGSFLDDSVVAYLPKNEVKYVMPSKNEKTDLTQELNYGTWPVFKSADNKNMDFSKSPTLFNDNQHMDDCCFGELEEGWYALTNFNKKVGFGMRWDKKVFPYIWMWRMYGKGVKEGPWWGRVECLAMELCSSLVLDGGLDLSVKNNTALKMKPQQEIETSFMAIAYEKSDNVQKINELGEIL